MCLRLGRPPSHCPRGLNSFTFYRCMCISIANKWDINLVVNSDYKYILKPEQWKYTNQIIITILSHPISSSVWDEHLTCEVFAWMSYFLRCKRLNPSPSQICLWLRSSLIRPLCGGSSVLPFLPRGLSPPLRWMLLHCHECNGFSRFNPALAEQCDFSTSAPSPAPLTKERHSLWSVGYWRSSYRHLLAFLCRLFFWPGAFIMLSFSASL